MLRFFTLMQAQERLYGSPSFAKPLLNLLEEVQQTIILRRSKYSMPQRCAASLTDVTRR